MVLSRSVALTYEQNKLSITASDAGAASGNVTVVYDRDAPEAVILAALEQVKEFIREREFNVNPPPDVT